MSVEQRVRGTGLLQAGRPVVVLLSGGRDSVCLLDLALRISGRVTALHVNFGLRGAASDADEAHCRALCERLGAPLRVHPATRPDGPGNLHAWAREERYAAAGRLAREADADVAVGHTASDQVETALYRLAASPGRRALLGMRERDGRLVRPLLGVTREETAAHCEQHDLPWVEDASNADPAFARSRVRHELLPVLRGLHPAAEANVLATLALLRDEAEVLDAAADAALRDAGWDGAAGGDVAVAALAALPAGLRRLAFQRLADAAAGGAAPGVGGRADEALDLAAAGGTQRLDLGGGLRAVVAYGSLRVTGGEEPPDGPEGPVALPVPGRLAWGAGELRSERGPDLPVDDGTLDAAACSGGLEVRRWRPGDRMRPLGLGGSKSLQDLFTDRKVPRDERGRLPVVVCGGEIAWVPGVATDERFAVTRATGERLRLAWRG